MIKSPTGTFAAPTFPPMPNGEHYSGFSHFPGLDSNAIRHMHQTFKPELSFSAAESQHGIVPSVSMINHSGQLQPMTMGMLRGLPPNYGPIAGLGPVSSL